MDRRIEAKETLAGIRNAACPMVAARSCFAQNPVCSNFSASLSFLGTAFADLDTPDNASCNAAGQRTGSAGCVFAIEP
ncbi:hypothetical protein AK812_SmicGene45374 [Symbiodinium microadriaticum]|uniref:Uncharacterized protein n=1 Tax=Symbiodinium microadriaticum TaxID=2951 RepID=A0A1Q9BWG0_SYMMI|nr:hypothetical protein AK812_SmicGene45374 [Symbiodinium microadriaticum]